MTWEFHGLDTAGSALAAIVSYPGQRDARWSAESLRQAIANRLSYSPDDPALPVLLEALAALKHHGVRTDEELIEQARTALEKRGIRHGEFWQIVRYPRSGTAVYFWRADDDDPHNHSCQFDEAERKLLWCQ